MDIDNGGQFYRDKTKSKGDLDYIILLGDSTQNERVNESLFVHDI